jgi:hypothetical protein
VDNAFGAWEVQLNGDVTSFAIQLGHGQRGDQRTAAMSEPIV